MYLCHFTDVIGITSPEQWYKVTSAALKLLGGSSMLTEKRSLANVVALVEPDTTLLPWLFDPIPYVPQGCQISFSTLIIDFLF